MLSIGQKVEIVGNSFITHYFQIGQVCVIIGLGGSEKSYVCKAIEGITHQVISVCDLKVLDGFVKPIVDVKTKTTGITSWLEKN